MPNIEETAARAADTATGAAAEAAEAVTDPAKQARRFERRGAPINRRLVHQAEDWARETARTAREMVDGTIPQRVANEGLRLVKSRARRRDVVGDATYRALVLLHDGAGGAARALNRLEEATQPPARPVRRHAETGTQRPAARRSATGPSATARTRTKTVRTAGRD